MRPGRSKPEGMSRVGPGSKAGTGSVWEEGVPTNGQGSSQLRAEGDDDSEYGGGAALAAGETTAQSVDLGLVRIGHGCSKGRPRSGSMLVSIQAKLGGGWLPSPKEATSVDLEVRLLDQHWSIA